MLTVLENMIANVSGNPIFRTSENIIDKIIENIVAFKKALAGILYLVVRRTMLYIYIYIYMCRVRDVHFFELAHTSP